MRDGLGRQTEDQVFNPGRDTAIIGSGVVRVLFFSGERVLVNLHRRYDVRRAEKQVMGCPAFIGQWLHKRAQLIMIGGIQAIAL